MLSPAQCVVTAYSDDEHYDGLRCRDCALRVYGEAKVNLADVGHYELASPCVGVIAYSVDEHAEYDEETDDYRGPFCVDCGEDLS